MSASAATSGVSIAPSRRLDFSEVPVVDVGSLVDGEHHEPTIEAVRRACSEVGFLYVKNHGVSRHLVEDLHAQAKRFFCCVNGRQDGNRS